MQRRALDLNPSLAFAYHGLGVCLIYGGETDEGLRSVETAIRLSPREFMLPMWKADIDAVLGVAGSIGRTPPWTLAMLFGNFVVLDHGAIEDVGPDTQDDLGRALVLPA